MSNDHLSDQSIEYWKSRHPGDPMSISVGDFLEIVSRHNTVCAKATTLDVELSHAKNFGADAIMLLERWRSIGRSAARLIEALEDHCAEHNIPSPYQMEHIREAWAEYTRLSGTGPPEEITNAPICDQSKEGNPS